MTPVPLPTFVEAEASFSACDRFRFRLSRAWDLEAPRLGWIMLNPSTADAEVLDPTVRRCVRFALSWGYGGIEVLNVSPFRTPYPRDLEAAIAEGVDVYQRPRRDRSLLEVLPRLGRVVAAWGAHRIAREEGDALCRLVREAGVEVVAVGRTSDGSPRHPLYVRGDVVPQPYPGGPA